jgi:predicted dehydrogenase
VIRLGFLGVGWIGRDRMRALVASGLAEAALVADASPDAAAEAAAEVGAQVVSPDELLAAGLDGVVIATPSALHAQQAIAALQGGSAVFCQKPLGRSAAETAEVVAAARDADRLLGVDLSYRHLAATAALRDVLGSGELGEVYAAELVFHNAYGPDKAWFRDPALSGGGCVIDLGTHLVDLALHLLPGAQVHDVSARLFAGGRPLAGRTDVVEDFATAQIDLDGGRVLTLGCSWDLHAGQEAVISATFHGTAGAVALTNVGGSFYDFRASRHTGTKSEVLSSRRTTGAAGPPSLGRQARRRRGLRRHQRRAGDDGRGPGPGVRPVRVLMTADAVGGVWTYAVELAHALRPHGVEVHLATLGRAPSPAQQQEAQAFAGLHVSSFPLEWEREAWQGVEQAGRGCWRSSRSCSPTSSTSTGTRTPCCPGAPSRWSWRTPTSSRGSGRSAARTHRRSGTPTAGPSTPACARPGSWWRRPPRWRTTCGRATASTAPRSCPTAVARSWCRRPRRSRWWWRPAACGTTPRASTRSAAWRRRCRPPSGWRGRGRPTCPACRCSARSPSRTSPP